MYSLLASLSLLVFSSTTTSPVFLFLILCSALVRSFLSFVLLRNQRLCMVPIKGPAVPVPDDAIMASCVGTAFCAALQCTCWGLFGLLDQYIVSNSMLTDARNKFNEEDNQLYWNLTRTVLGYYYDT